VAVIMHELVDHARLVRSSPCMINQLVHDHGGCCHRKLPRVGSPVMKGSTGPDAPDRMLPEESRARHEPDP
jgi:hypothetical protein